MKNYFSLRIKLNDVIKDESFEKIVCENLRRARKVLGKSCRVEFWHEGLNESVIKDFVKRNENLLFKINTKITKKHNLVWFSIDNKNEDKCESRFKWKGDILQGIVKYTELLLHTLNKGKK